jgi:origin recognition complex subunit 3
MVLFQLRGSLQMAPHAPLSSIWIRAASGEMLDSPLLRETMLSIKKIASDKFGRLLDAAVREHMKLPIDVYSYQQALGDLVKDADSSTVLRTRHDVRNDSLRTTIVAQKVLLSKHKAALSDQDKAYSELVHMFQEELEGYFNATFIDPRPLFPIEILMFDLKSPHTEAFQPKPRFAIERALASPHDYLGCDCCVAEGVDGEVALSATQPATAIMYQLYLESGTLINVSDLWSAFQAIAGEGEEGESKTA